MNKNYKNSIKKSYLSYFPENEYSFSKSLKFFIKNTGYRFIVLYRKMEYSKCKILSIVYKIILKKMKIKYGLRISNSTQIGEEFHIVHTGGIIINENTVIGENFKIRQNTTIGTDGISSKCPIIGNNVNVGAHVCIIGNIRIGNNVIIGAGSIVVKDVPDDVIIVGNPARVIKKYNKKTKRYEKISNN